MREVCKTFLWELSNRDLCDVIQCHKKITRRLILNFDPEKSEVELKLVFKEQKEGCPKRFVVSIEKKGLDSEYYHVLLSILIKNYKKYESHLMQFDNFEVNVKKDLVLDENGVNPNGLTLLLEIFDVHYTPDNQACRVLENRPDFETFYKNPKFSDILLIVENEELPAHKIVLANQSKFFARIFEKDTKYKLELQDIDLATARNMLWFMYAEISFKIKNEESAEKLLVASEKYEIEGLRKECEVYLSNRLNIDNLMRLLNLSDECNAPNLESRAIEYVVENAKSISKDEFRLLFQKLGTDMAAEIMCSMADKNV